MSSSPSKNAKVNLKIFVFLLLCMNLQLGVLQERENRVRPFADKVPGRICRSFATTVSKLKICDFSGEKSKSFEVL
jgi:hypothetical protein